MSDVRKLDVCTNPGLSLAERREQACEELDQFLFTLSKTHDLKVMDMMGIIELVKFRQLKDSFDE